MRVENRTKSVFGILIMSILIGDVGTHMLTHMFATPLVTALMVVVSLYWGMMWGVGLAREKKESHFLTAGSYSFAITLAMLAGFWQWYGKNVEMLAESNVHNQTLTLVGIAIVIGLCAEFKDEISSLPRRFKKSKTAL
jgi:hypothetical protein